jgi:cytochrome c-type biogenesis protein CcmE
MELTPPTRADEPSSSSKPERSERSVELTPRTLTEDAPPVRPRRSPLRRWLPLAVVGLVLVALGFVVVKGLDEATVYFRNADEAVADRQELGDRRFRLQGTVAADALETDDGARFDVVYGGVSVAVRHAGDPPNLFRPGVPVVLEGRWDPSGEFFASDRMMVRHDAEYESREDYEERMREAEGGAP